MTNKKSQAKISNAKEPSSKQLKKKKKSSDSSNNRSGLSVMQKEVHSQIRQIQKNLKSVIFSVAVIVILMAVLLFFIANSQDPCSDLKGIQKDECYSENALDNVKYCFDIDNAALKESCISSYAIAKNDTSICSDLSEKSQGYCQKSIAVNTEDVSSCLSIDDSFWRNECYISFSNMFGDYAICKNIKDNLISRNNCLYDSALSLNESSACESIDDDNQRSLCYYRLAVQIDEPELCSNDLLLNYEGMCYLKFAKQQQDEGFCDGISSSLIRDECLAYFNRTSVN
ncbi:hypothetical protein H6503_05760 [Candidatus Woesearchaeota archaeon]|nr:hypothetical protein [Candidatus Woesearchaeota archaeon]